GLRRPLHHPQGAAARDASSAGGIPCGNTDRRPGCRVRTGARQRCLAGSSPAVDRIRGSAPSGGFPSQAIECWFPYHSSPCLFHEPLRTVPAFCPACIWIKAALVDQSSDQTRGAELAYPEILLQSVHQSATLLAHIRGKATDVL